ncbi:uncharacterized protein KGF55_000406 [Candida pseudojiufengensis]|uniref:uncharacterized protein n=1 Tax=Candida pseudojiufengensis TaxID=497109 RepID=UPI002225905F|nr:uncharacterized protein KGF55_000406 [Candida pseudojiufengensis]KAI5966997.1 hypothetical protein KGF55_000406 [Candida pseudojiufengensis]
MSTISLNITYLTQQKKVTISKSQTISQLISQCLTTFKIDSSQYSGDLYHNDKLLDSATPIRLTNLINNSKLNFKIKKIDLNKLINVKFINDKGSSINKFTISTTLKQIVESFKSPVKNTQLRILNLTIDYTNYESTTLGSIVGSSNSVVIRLEEIKSKLEIEKLAKKQEEANKLYLQQEIERKKAEEAKAIEDRKEQENREKYADTHETLNKEEENEDVEMADVEESNTREPAPETTPISYTADAPQQPSQLESTQTELTESTESPSSYVYKEEEFKETPQLYVPSQSSSNSTNKDQSPIYQNPEEDYNMTVNQAKTYQNVIRNSAKRNNPKKETKKPTKYLIRIKFPDGSILQLNFLKDINTLKFGQFLKKIDEILLPEFLNNYNLKLGYPSFKKLNQSFSNNNELLINLEEFSSNEQIILIWELSSSNINHKGPFLNNQSQDLIIKPKDELPERKLEKYRKNLPSDDNNNEKSQKGSFLKNPKSSSNNDDEKKKSKLPKWLKMNKK